MIFSGSPMKYITDVDTVLKPLQNERGLIKLNKCRFILETINFLEHTICPRRHKVPLHIMDEILCVRAATNLTEQHSFIEFCKAF